jgi:hypothetical protein
VKTSKKPLINVLRYSSKVPPKSMEMQQQRMPEINPAKAHKEYEKILRQHRKHLRSSPNKSTLDGVVMVRAREKIADITSGAVSKKLNRLSQQIETLHNRGKIEETAVKRKKTTQKVHFGIIDVINAIY